MSKKNSPKKKNKKAPDQRNRTIKNVPCSNPDYMIHLIDRPGKDGKHYVNAYLVDARTLQRADKNNWSRKYDPKIQKPKYAHEYLVRRINNEVAPEKNPSSGRKHGKDLANGPLAQAYRAFLASQGVSADDPDRFKISFWSSWGESTTRTYLIYFEGRVLPVLDQILSENSGITHSDMEALRIQLEKKALESKKSLGDSTTAGQSVNKQLRAARIIYDAIREATSEFALPFLPVVNRLESNLPGKEQIKAIPNEVRVRLAAMLLYCLEPTGLACGLAMMLFGGLRTAEAAAPLFGEIAVHGDYATYTVSTQINDNKELDPVLKTTSAYRTVTFPYAFVAFYHKAVAFLKEKGHSDDEIQQMPFVAEHLTDHIRPPKLSSYILDTLKCCGCTEDFLEQQRDYLKHYPDYDAQGRRVGDLSAYVLRRDYATRLSFICGVRMDVLDCLMGHKRDDVKLLDLNSPDLQRDVFQALERFVFLPEFSKNPAFSPVIGEKSGGQVQQVVGIELTTEEDGGEVVLVLQANEPGQHLIIDIPNGVQVNDIQISQREDKPSQRAGRPISGKHYPLDYYQKLTAETRRLNFQAGQTANRSA